MAVTQQADGTFYSDVTGGIYRTAQDAHDSEAAGTASTSDFSGGANVTGQSPAVQGASTAAADPRIAASNALMAQGYRDLDGDGFVTQADVNLAKTPYGASTAAGGTATDYQVQTYAPGKNDVAGRVVSQVIDPTTGASAGSRVATETTDPSTGAKTGYSQQMAVQNPDGSTGMIPVNPYNIANSGNRQVNAALVGGANPGYAAPGGAGGAAGGAPLNPNAGLTGQQVLGAGSPGAPAAGTPGATPGSGPASPPAAPPVVDDSKIQPLLSGIQTYAAQIAALGGDTSGLTTALAQLASSSQAAQSAALSQARSGDRRGQGQAVRQAVGEIGYTQQQSARDAALVRASDAEADRTFKLNALNTAAGLGLNTGALQVDIGKANLGAATSYFNDQFAELGNTERIDESKAESLLGFTKDMAALQYQYDALSNTDQQAILDRELKKWSVSQEDATQLQAIKDQRKLNWGDILTKAVGGAVSGATSAGATALLSDARTKTDVSDTTDQDLEELLSKFKSKKFRYKKEFGGMAQDLERSRLGAAMVSKHGSGLLQVDGARAGVAALSGLSFVFKRLQALEASL